MQAWRSKGGDVPSGRVEISNVRVAFGDTAALHGLNFDVAPGEIVGQWSAPWDSNPEPMD